MPLVDLTGRLVDASGEPVGSVTVRARALGIHVATDDDPGGIVVGVSAATTDTGGNFTLHLRPSSELRPAGTKYRISASGRGVRWSADVLVPDADTDLAALLDAD